MATKATTVVVIDKKEYNLSGFEEEEYLQKVAAYINQKIAKMNQQDSYKRLSQDMKNIMLQLNIADDYFKAKEQADDSGTKFSELEKEIFSLKHQLVDAQMKLDDTTSKLELVKVQNVDVQEQLKKLEKENQELKMKNEKLEHSLEEALLEPVSDHKKNPDPKKNVSSFDKYKVR